MRCKNVFRGYFGDNSVGNGSRIIGQSESSRAQAVLKL